MLVENRQTLRLLIVMPSWVGDAVMATPAITRIRHLRPGITIGALVRPGIDELLDGTDFFDTIHVEARAGVMGPKRAAANVRANRYDTALLFTNSFATALITRLAFIPRRIGYSRDSRAMLLTDRLHAPKRPDGSWAPIPAVTYYWNAACVLLDLQPHTPSPGNTLPPGAVISLNTTEAQEQAADDILAKAGIKPDEPLAILNPGGNNQAKRWPPERYAALADHLTRQRQMTILLNGSPAEAELVSHIADLTKSKGGPPPVELPKLGMTIGALKAITRRAQIMITNDTGPRHIAAAFNIPIVSLFGPTDHRWTTIPAPGGERLILADPTLPEDELANDDPDRNSIDKIELDTVAAAVDELLVS